MGEHFIQRMQKEKYQEENKHLFDDLKSLKDKDEQSKRANKFSDRTALNAFKKAFIK